MFQGGKSVSRSDVETILEPMSLNALEKLGDWLVLYFIVRNLDTLTVNQVRYSQMQTIMYACASINCD
jgi:hypothetical protein